MACFDRRNWNWLHFWGKCVLSTTKSTFWHLNMVRHNRFIFYSVWFGFRFCKCNSILIPYISSPYRSTALSSVDELMNKCINSMQPPHSQSNLSSKTMTNNTINLHNIRYIQISNGKFRANWIALKTSSIRSMFYAFKVYSIFAFELISFI